MEFELKANPASGQMVMPAIIRRAWGCEYKLAPNRRAGAIYPKDADPRAVKASLQVIIQELENLIQMEEVKRG